VNHIFRTNIGGCVYDSDGFYKSLGEQRGLKATYLLRPGVRNLRWQIEHGYTGSVSASIDLEGNIVTFDTDGLPVGEVREDACRDKVLVLLLASVKDLGDDTTVTPVSELPGYSSDDLIGVVLIISTVPSPL
jgi:hypothetical protein